MKKISILSIILFALFFNIEIIAQQNQEKGISNSESNATLENILNQDTAKIKTTQDEIIVTGKIFDFVDVMPEFNIKGTTIEKFIKKNLQYPQSAKEKKLEGTIILGFAVTKEGQTANVKVWKSFDSDCAAEAVRVVKLFKWTPGTLNGEKVAVNYTIPIRFSL